MKVFIAGSRRLSRLTKDVTRRIDSILAKRLTVVIGDANGVDKAVQKYLNSQHYENVLVFCMDNACRNNEGGWQTRKIQAPDVNRHNFAFYSTKDRAMAEVADYGLMLWDGESRGTLTNIVDLVRQSKPVVVYLAPSRQFFTVKQTKDLAKILGQLDPSALVRVSEDLQLQIHGPGRISDRRREDPSSLF